MNDKEGFTMLNIPAQRERVCNGCKYLNKVAGLRSRTEHLDTYSCTHPDSMVDSLRVSSIFGEKGKLIDYNIPYPCKTPSWCPFLKPKQNEKSVQEG